MNSNCKVKIAHLQSISKAQSDGGYSTGYASSLNLWVLFFPNIQKFPSSALHLDHRLPLPENALKFERIQHTLEEGPEKKWRSDVSASLPSRFGVYYCAPTHQGNRFSMVVEERRRKTRRLRRSPGDVPPSGRTAPGAVTAFWG